jgi:hypothetical protein
MWVAFFWPEGLIHSSRTPHFFCQNFLRFCPAEFINPEFVPADHFHTCNHFSIATSSARSHPSQVMPGSTHLTVCQRDAYHFRSVLTQL